MSADGKPDRLYTSDDLLQGYERDEPSSWEVRFWHAVEIILETHGDSIDTWIGANNVKAPKELLPEYKHAVEQAAKVRVITAAQGFRSLPKKEREAAHATAKRLRPYDVYRAFKVLSPNIWDLECPACKSKSFLAGVQYNEEMADDQGDAGFPDEAVDVYYIAEDSIAPLAFFTLMAGRPSKRPTSKSSI
ncbi:hypothetical protein [Bradyrhizobium genosp. A]|uniref:hypothetical protein n=1 Tax=Bradyrhizobium genosp. A TaxID=83626 RepID=UPI003CF1270C